MIRQTDLLIGVVDPLSVGGLELEGDAFLLGRNQLLVAASHPLGVLLVLDGLEAPERKKTIIMPLCSSYNFANY
jgi:hypothetical protein